MTQTPRIERRPALRLIGLVRDYDHNEDLPSLLPRQWADLDAHMEEASPTPGVTAFGVALPSATPDRFRYMTALLVGSERTPSGDLELLILPAGTYRIRPHPGHVSTLHETVALACGGHEPPSGRPSFLEYYGPGFDPRTGLGDIEVWTPIDEER